MSPIARQRVAIAVAALLGACVFWAPAWRHLHATGFGDWQMVHHNWEVGFIALTRFGEWPLWNPFFCGGITAFGNPETQWFSPFTWVALITGTTIGTKIFLTLHAAIGLSGMFVLARHPLGLGLPASIVSSVAWGCSGFFAWHGAGGHATFLPFYFAPWLLMSWRRAWSEPRWAIATSAILALTLCEGGTYPFPYFVLWLALDTLFALLSPTHEARSGMPLASFVRRLAPAIAIAALLTLLMGAIRLLPIADSLAQLPRDTTDDDALALAELIEMFTARDHPWRYPPHRFVWPEYGTFVGWTVLALAAIGSVSALARRRWNWLLGLAAFVALVLGEGGPWSWLHHLPVFDSLRVPSRFMVLVTFYLALLAGIGLQALVDAGNARVTQPAAPRVIQGAALLVALIATVDVFAVNLRTIDRWHGPPVVAGPAAEHFHLLRVRNFHELYASLPARHQGISGCYNGGMNWVVSRALWTGDVPQGRFESPGLGEVLGVERTVNTLTLRVRADRDAAHLVLNQNYDRDWVSDVGLAVEDRGRLALELPRGTHEITLRYRPRTLGWGAMLSLIGVGLALLGLRKLGPSSQAMSQDSA